MPSESTQKHGISKIIILYKVISGALELFLGLGILFFGNTALRLYTQFRKEELLENPHDIMVRFTQAAIPIFTHHRTYIIFLLLTLGITKIVAAYGLAREKQWALDLVIALFFVLLPFDLFSLFIHPSFLQLLYTCINALIMLYLVEFKPHRYLSHVKKRYIDKTS